MEFLQKCGLIYPSLIYSYKKLITFAFINNLLTELCTWEQKRIENMN